MIGRGMLGKSYFGRLSLGMISVMVFFVLLMTFTTQMLDEYMLPNIYAGLISSVAVLLYSFMISKINNEENRLNPTLLSYCFFLVSFSYIAIILPIGRYLWGISQDGSYLSMFFIEEVFKFAVVLFLLKFSKKTIKEPLDVVYLASFIGLFLGFVENMHLNFVNIIGVKDTNELYTIVAIGLFDISVQVTSSAIWGYALGLYKMERASIYKVILFFVIGSFLHTLHDFAKYKYFVFASTTITLVLIAVFGVIVWKVKKPTSPKPSHSLVF